MDLILPHGMRRRLFIVLLIWVCVGGMGGGATTEAELEPEGGDKEYMDPRGRFLAYLYHDLDRL